MRHSGIGELTVLAELGAGAGSRVFHVRRLADAAEYALKVVAADRLANPRYVTQLQNEFRVGQMLDHPNLTKVHSFEVRRDWRFRPTTARLLLEYAPGRPLNRLLLKPGRLLRVFEQTAAALAHMHERGVFHADVKPENLIFDPATGVKVIDYGLARVAGEPKRRMQGTLSYMAPETAANQIVNERTDIYNLGATMYHLLTRRSLAPPTPGVAFGARMHAARVQAVSVLAPESPPELCELIHGCISHDPDQRPGQAREVQAILHRLANESEAKESRGRGQGA